VRSHGWSGNAPSSDEEAIGRILDAADEIVAERGSAVRIADVARSLGVTRQTVYRYFPSSEALLLTTAMRSADGFLDRLAAHLSGQTDPVRAVVEGMAFAVECLADDTRLAFVLSESAGGSRSHPVISEAPLAFARSMLHRLDVDWAAHGYGEAALDELSEFCLRLLNSFLVVQGRHSRGGKELRRYLTRWIGPAIAYPQLVRAMDSIGAAPVPGGRGRRAAAS
jgi:AcrR family transcriptional regulator